LQVEAAVELLPEHVAGEHEPSFVPFGIGEQVPLPIDVAALLHDSQDPLQVLLQQNPSMQLPLLHCPATLAHAAPFPSFVPQVPALQ